MLLRKPRAYAEVYNDLDGEIVNLFRVLRDEAQSARLIELLRLTPFAREELQLAMQRDSVDAVERARRLIVYAFQGHGANAHARVPTGLRGAGNLSGRASPAAEWGTYPDALAMAIARLRGVLVEHRDARLVMAANDRPDTLHYVDPPYVHSTRGRGNPADVAYRGYTHELDDEDHAELLEFLRELKGFVILSGYPHELYDRMLPDWRRVERRAMADGARERTEVLWLNPACVQQLKPRPEQMVLA